MKEKFYTPENKKIIAKCKIYGITAFLVFALSVILYFAIKRNADILGFISTIISALAPIITGFVFAFLLNPIMLFFEKLFNKKIVNKLKNKKLSKKISKYSSIAISIIILLLVIALIAGVIIPNLVISIGEVTTDLPEKAQNGYKWVQNFIPHDIFTTLQNKITEYLKKLINGDLFNSFEIIAKYFANSMKGIYNFVINFLVGIIISIYVLAGKDYFKKISQKFLCVVFKKNTVHNIVITAKESHRIFTNFIVGKLIDSLIVGIICFILMLIFRLPYALLISFIIAITNIIPFFGPFIGAIPSALLIFLNSPLKSLYFIILIILLQQFDGNILGPKVLKGSIGISSFWVIFSIMFFGGFFGFVGMLIGAPLFAVIYNIVSKIINKKLKQKNLPLNDEAYIDITKTM